MIVTYKINRARRWSYLKKAYVGVLQRSCLGLHSFAAGKLSPSDHSMFHNPTAAVNLFHVGKQYMTLCKAEAAVTRNLIGRKIISNVKHADARNSLPI